MRKGVRNATVVDIRSAKMKIYTKTGDKGTTSLYGGKRVKKNHPRIKVCGSIDELNSLLGVALTKLEDKKVKEFIEQVQKDLFLIGTNLSDAPANLDIFSQRVEEMEKYIDEFSEKLPKLKNFILPRGNEAACYLFFARAVARRLERELVALSDKESVDEKILVYFNRLSDLLFVMGRYVNFKKGTEEEIWKGK